MVFYTSGTASGLRFKLGGSDPINGSAGGDILVGTPGNDILNGNGGDDSLTGGAGADVLNGGSGLDSAKYTGTSISYTINGDASSATIVANGNSDGTDNLTSVERLVFSDGVIALDVGQGGHGGDIYRLYQAAFDREPDTQGIGFWIAQMDNGMSIEIIATGFMNSDEFRSDYGLAPSNVALVTKMYENVLHRAPDQEGLNWYVGLLDKQAVSAAAVLVDISQSDENFATTIGKISNGFLFTPYVE